MRPRFVGRLGPADFVTVSNAVLGFVAVFVAPGDPRLAARLVLLAAIADGLDGVVARHVRSTPVGTHLDSLADVVSFGVAPALIVSAYAIEAWTLSGTASPRVVLAVGIPALFVGMVVVRLGLYAVYDADDHHTEGVPSTLAATLLAAAVLAIDGPLGGFAFGPLLLVGAALLTYLMVTTVTYPDLLPRDAFIMGAVQALAVAFPGAVGRTFPYALLTLAVAYLLLAPRFYWRPPPNGAEGKR
ncbi:MAG: protein sorting system archaetidylserine synthase [Halobacteriales archaeon]